MATDEPESFFPELQGEERREADEWLREYLTLVLQISRQAGDQECQDYPQDRH